MSAHHASHTARHSVVSLPPQIVDEFEDFNDIGAVEDSRELNRSVSADRLVDDNRSDNIGIETIKLSDTTPDLATSRNSADSSQKRQMRTSCAVNADDTPLASRAGSADGRASRRSQSIDHENQSGNNGNDVQSSTANFHRTLLSKVSKRRKAKAVNLIARKPGNSKIATPKRASSFEPPKQILVSNQIKIRELRNELETWKSRCESIGQETRTLMHVVHLQERSISDIDTMETSFARIYEMQQEKLRSLRQSVRKSREKYDQCEANRLKLENEHRLKLRRLQELEELVKERGLDERHELQLRVGELEDDLNAKNTRVRELERHLIIMEKLHKRELLAENEKIKALHRDNSALTNLIAQLESQLRHKEHELEILNIYSLRFPSNVTRKQNREQRINDSTPLQSIGGKKLNQDETAKLNQKQPLPSIEQAITPVYSRHDSLVHQVLQEPDPTEASDSVPESSRTNRFATPPAEDVEQDSETLAPSEEAAGLQAETTTPSVENQSASLADDEDRLVDDAPGNTEETEVEAPTVTEALPGNSTPIHRNISYVRVAEPDLIVPITTGIYSPTTSDGRDKTEETQELPTTDSIDADKSESAENATDSLEQEHDLEPTSEQQQIPAEKHAGEFDAIEAFFKSLDESKPDGNKVNTSVEQGGEKQIAPTNIHAALRLLKDRRTLKKLEVKHSPPKEYSFVQTIDNLYRGLPPHPVSKRRSRASSFAQLSTNADEIFATREDKLPIAQHITRSVTYNPPESLANLLASTADERDHRNDGGSHVSDLGRTKSGKNGVLPDLRYSSMK